MSSPNPEVQELRQPLRCRSSGTTQPYLTAAACIIGHCGDQVSVFYAEWAGKKDSPLPQGGQQNLEVHSRYKVDLLWGARGRASTADLMRCKILLLLIRSVYLRGCILAVFLFSRSSSSISLYNSGGLPWLTSLAMQSRSSPPV